MASYRASEAGHVGSDGRFNFYGWNSSASGRISYHPARVAVTVLSVVSLICASWWGAIAYLNHRQASQYVMAFEPTAAQGVSRSPSSTPSMTPQPTVSRSESPSASNSPSASAVASPSPSATSPAAQEQQFIPTNILIPPGDGWGETNTIIYPKPDVLDRSGKPINWGVPKAGDLDTASCRETAGQRVDAEMAVTLRSSGPTSVGAVIKPGEVPPVLFGHTGLDDASGAFKDIPKLTVGSAVMLYSCYDNSSRQYEALKYVPDLNKVGDALSTELNNAPPGAVAALVTCVGSLNDAGNSHEDNGVLWIGHAPNEKPTAAELRGL